MFLCKNSAQETANFATDNNTSSIYRSKRVVLDNKNKRYMTEQELANVIWDIIVKKKWFAN